MWEICVWNWSSSPQKRQKNTPLPWCQCHHWQLLSMISRGIIILLPPPPPKKSPVLPSPPQKKIYKWLILKCNFMKSSKMFQILSQNRLKFQKKQLVLIYIIKKFRAKLWDLCMNGSSSPPQKRQENTPPPPHHDASATTDNCYQWSLEVRAINQPFLSTVVRCENRLTFGSCEPLML